MKSSQQSARLLATVANLEKLVGGLVVDIDNLLDTLEKVMVRNNEPSGKKRPHR